MYRFLILSLIALAACATPQERCERAATKDLETIDELIVETRRNLERGYAIEQQIVRGPDLRFCAGNRHHHVGVLFCNAPRDRVIDRPVAIDRNAELRKLESLEEQRRRLVRRSTEEIKACRAANT